jgi:hypothetical protein
MSAKRTSFNPPTPAEVKEYAGSIGFTALDAEYFCDKHEAVGWVTKNNVAIRDWKAVVRTWKRYEATQQMVKKPAAPMRTPGEEANEQYMREYIEKISDIRSWRNSPTMCPFGDPREAEDDLMGKIYLNHGAAFVRRLKGRRIDL